MKTEYVYKYCQAPLCNKTIRVKKRTFLQRVFGPKQLVFCPEHKERMTNGRVSDNDPNTNPDLEPPSSGIMRLWRITYLVGFGAMSIHEEEEFFRAFTKKGAWKKFNSKYGDKGPSQSYQCNYSYSTMKNDITLVSSKP